jgi:hypothetical protein
MTEPAALQDIAENLSFLDDWEDRLNYLIELGQALRQCGKRQDARHQGEGLRFERLAGVQHRPIKRFAGP